MLPTSEAINRLDMPHEGVIQKVLESFRFE